MIAATTQPRLVRGLDGYRWIVDRCPLCGGRHIYHPGPPGETREARCWHGLGDLLLEQPRRYRREPEPDLVDDGEGDPGDEGGDE